MLSHESNKMFLDIVQSVRKSIDSGDTSHLDNVEDKLNNSIHFYESRMNSQTFKKSLEQLKELTGQGLYTCKNFLDDSHGDVELALERMNRPDLIKKIEEKNDEH